MDTLFDLLNNAQGGKAIDNLARQFELSRQQAMAAAQALLPAFSLGLKRQVDTARSASTLPSFFGLPGMPEADAFQNAAQAFTQEAIRQGQQIMATIFGSPEMARAVSRFAAAQSGVAAPAIAAMMPAMASILVGGLAHAAAPRSSGNPMVDMMTSMMQAFQPPAPASAPGYDLAALWAPFLAPHQPAQRTGPENMFSQMLDAGSQMQKAQTEAVNALFETWWGK